MHKLLLTLSAGLLFSGAAFADEQKALIEVGGLYCPSCSYIAGEAMKMADTVVITDAVVSEDGTTAVYHVTFDDSEVTAVEIAEMTLIYGYPSKVLPSDGSNS